MHPTRTLERVLKTIALTRYEGFLCRAVKVNALHRFSHTAHYTPRPLYNLGPPSGGARFTPRGGAPSLYLADDYETSLREYLQVGWPAGLAPARTEPPSCAMSRRFVSRPYWTSRSVRSGIRWRPIFGN